MVGGLFVLCVLTRLWDLGAKPVMHDEALFLYYTEYHLVRAFDYRYQPILHGPLHLWIQGFLFWLLGSSDSTMRLGSALLGIAGFWWVFLLRPWLGRAGTSVSLLFYTLSPGILYYSRFFREDGVFLFIEFWIIASLAWWWRTRSRAWLASFLFALGVLFSNKESSLFVYFILLMFLVVAVAHDLLGGMNKPQGTPYRSFPNLPRLSPMLIATFFFVAVSMILTQVIEGIRFDADVVSTLGHDFVLGDVRSIPLALGWQAPIEQAGRLGSPWFWRAYYVLLVGACAGLGHGIQMAVEKQWGRRQLAADLAATLWRGRFAGIAALSAAFLVYLVLFTTFFKYPENPFSLVQRTLAYWMGQHAIHRIYGPFHQHMLNLAVYELPLLLLWMMGTCALVFREGWTRFSGAALVLCALPLLVLHAVVSLGVPSPPSWFLATGLLSLAAGGFAIAQPRFGGRIALSLLLLTIVLSISWFASDSWARFLLDPITSGSGETLFASGRQLLDDRLSLTSGVHLALIAILILAATVATWRSLDRGDRLQAFLIWYFVVMLGAASYAREKVPQVGIHASVPLVLLAGLYAQRIWNRVGRARNPLPRMVFMALIGVAAIWQTRAAFHLAFVNAGDVRERFVYGDTTPDVKHHAGLIMRARNVADIRHQPRPGSLRPEWIEGYNEPRTLKDVRVHIADFDIVWPLRWYLRDVDYRVGNDIAQAVDEKMDFIFLPLGSESTPGLAENYHLYRGRLRMHWVPEPLSTDRLLAGWRATIPKHNLSDPQARAQADLAAREWKRIRDYMLFRTVSYDRDPGLSHVEYYFAVRTDLPPF